MLLPLFKAPQSATADLLAVEAVGVLPLRAPLGRLGFGPVVQPYNNYQDLAVSEPSAPTMAATVPLD
jgi:hypothetical protein